MYKIVKPIRIAQKSEDVNIIAVPQRNLRFEANQNVTDLFIYLGDCGDFDDGIIERFTEKYDIINKEDYKSIFEDLKSMEVIIEA